MYNCPGLKTLTGIKPQFVSLALQFGDDYFVVNPYPKAVTTQWKPGFLPERTFMQIMFICLVGNELPVL